MHKKNKEKARNKEKNMKKMKREREKNKGQTNPLTCEIHFFTNWTFKLDTMPLHTLIVPYKKVFF
jgi:hypothetical protein